MLANARRGTSVRKVRSGVFSGSASWIITNFKVGLAYSDAVMIAAAASISAPLSGSSG